VNNELSPSGAAKVRPGEPLPMGPLDETVISSSTTISSWRYVCATGGSEESVGPKDLAREERLEAVRPFSAAVGAKLVLGPTLGARLPARDAGRDEEAAIFGWTDGAREARRDGGREALRGEVIGSWDGARRLRGELKGSREGACRLRGEEGPKEGARDVARPVVGIGWRSVSRSSVSSPMAVKEASGSSERSSDIAAVNAGYVISTLGVIWAASSPRISYLKVRQSGTD
jgi:hypothetical protein